MAKAPRKQLTGIRINGRDLADFSAEELAEHEAQCERNLREVIRSRQFPSLRTDDTFFRGRRNYRGITPKHRQVLVNNARKNGISTEGKAYLPGLNSVGMAPGADPEAWVQGRGDIRRVCERRGTGCEGEGINIKMREEPADEKPSTGLADDLAEELTTKAIARDPSLKSKKRQEVKEAVIDKHGSKRVGKR